MNQSILQVGQAVYTDLYARGRGYIYAIHGEQRPENCRLLGGGVVVMGGRATVDIVFECGSESLHLPESILRGIQWRILPEIVDAGKLQVLRNHAAVVKKEKEDAAAVKAAKFQAEADALKVSPEWAFLEQGSDDSSGKLAAANIRRELKREFPGVKFSVRKPDWGSVDIRYPKGSLTDEGRKTLRRIQDKYQSGFFDGMQDIYEYRSSPWNKVFGGAKYVSAYENWE